MQILKKSLVWILIGAMIFMFASCDKDTPSGSDSTGDKGETVTLKVFTNLPDRKSGQGFIEQTIFDNYMKENSNVKIVVEALDDEQYKTKFKAYSTGSDQPDLVNSWGHASFISEVIDAGVLAELNKADYSNYGFIDGTFDGFSKNGKLYGLPRNTDIMGFFYNKAIFEENNWKVPKTYDELLTLAEAMKAKNIIPCAMDGADKWPVSIYLHDMTTKIGGDVKEMWKSSIADGDFSDPTYKKALELLQKSVNAGLFQSGFESADYGTAMNLFANGQAAMFYMGSWEMSMATNPDVLEKVRNNVDAFMMPVIDESKAKITDITAWNGGGYSIMEKSKNKAEAIKLLNYMFLPENWTKLAWENNVCMSAQDYTKFVTGKETPVQKTFVEIFKGISSISAVTFNDLGTSAFKTTSEDLSQEVAISSITPDKFIEELEKASK